MSISPATPVKTMEFDQADLANTLFGIQNHNLAVIAACTGATLETRGSHLTLRANDQETLDKVSSLVAQLYGLVKTGKTLTPEDVSAACSMFMQKPELDLVEHMSRPANLSNLRKNIAARTINQQAYLKALEQNEMVFAIGPAGTGKTYLAVAVAVASLLAKKVKRIILTRPAVEAGEKLGYLPGDLAEKVNPYLRPLYDALNDMLEPAKVNEMMETGVIEVAPLAFMRGRTLNNSFIILDEAQNTTPEQMKMFLTRLGTGSRAVITGDVTQIDLPPTEYHRGQDRSGLVQASNILKNIESLAFITFNEGDVVRHPLVARIVTAYERYEKK